MSTKKMISLLISLLVLVFGYITTSTRFFPSLNPPITSLPPNNNASQQESSHTIGQQTKTSACQAHSGLPDSACTPGAILPSATKDQICVSGYSKSVRNVSYEKKQQVYAEYGIASHSPGEYEVDHLVSLELGGSNDSANLWPEAAEPRPGFHEKDMVENYLHQQICSGAISLQQAQQEIATNWLQIYQNTPNIQQYQY